MIRLQTPPDIDAPGAEAACAEHYGLRGATTPLPGERDRNFLLETQEGRRYVVKFSSPDEPGELLEFEAEMMARLGGDTDGLVPAVVRARSGAGLVSYEDGEGKVHRMRIVDFLPGTPLAYARPRSLELLEDLGRRMGQLDSALGAYPDHPPPRLGFDWALGRAGEVMERGLELLEGERYALIESTLAAFRAREKDFLGLGSQIIHADVNDHNVLVSGPLDLPRRVTGIIDLGDAHSAPRVFDLAIALAYAILDTPDPLAAAAALVRGYHAALPILELEIDVVSALVRARLGQSVCISAWRRREGSAEDYHLVSEEPAWRMLRTLEGIPETLATGVLRAACGMEPVRRAAPLRKWLAKQNPAPVIDLPENRADVGVLDLSVASPLLDGRDTDDTAAFTRRVWAAMRERGLEVGVGRWLEPRAFYLTEAFAGRSGEPRERRTIHLGADLFVEPGVEVHAPLSGTVKSVRDNAARLDYGPTVIVEHQGPAGPFWTLYGHLERASVAGLEPGTEVRAGHVLGRVGPHPENGDWPPHLHFQIVTDLLGFEGEFPGVALPREREVWASLSPDPNLLLRLPDPIRFEEPNTQRLLERRREVLGPSLSVSYSRPIHVVRGRGAHLYDALGRGFLDCVNNVAHVGHEHPTVVRAGRGQMRVLNTNTRYLHERVVEYAERLVALFPDPLSVCWFVNSGSEANELALRMARAATGAAGVVSLEGGYHGNTQGLVDVSHYKFAGPGGRGAPPWSIAVPMPDDYRGRYRRDDPARAARYAAHVKEAFTKLAAEGHGACAFLAESILSCAGQIEPPEGFLAAAYAHARAAGAVCIADEVQTGLGRVGSAMWAYETQGVVPDIVTLGKPIGNGHPLGAVVTTRAIAQAFDNGMEFFSTFGGNPVSAAIGLAVLDVLEEEGLQAHAARVGARLKAGLAAMAGTHAAVGDVRGRGLFLGVELVRDRSGPTPAPEIARYVVERMRERGVLLSTDGPDENVLKIKPPMCFSEADAARLVEELDRVLGEDFVRACLGGEGEMR